MLGKTPRMEKNAPKLIVAQLNARVLPLHRGEFFEDPLDEELQRAAIGEVSGGGTMQNKSDEVDFCDIEIDVADFSSETVAWIIDLLERLGAPKGSKLKTEGENEAVPFGVSEGLAIYLNGTDLPESVYQTCDSNFVYSELDRLLDGRGRVLSYWQGPTETAFYLYGPSFDEMKAKISEFVATYPLCQKSRVERIA